MYDQRHQRSTNDADHVAAPSFVGSATVEEAVDTVGDRFTVELTADRDGPPWPIRMRKWLKEAGRAHGLTCDGVLPVADRPTGHLSQTNAPGNWRSRGRGVRGATAATPARSTAAGP